MLEEGLPVASKIFFYLEQMVVRRFVLKLLSDIKVLEQRVFEINIGGEKFPVEFKLELLPNDMKMLAFLAGELSNSALYFTTFGNVNQHDVNDINKRFSLQNDKDWKPFPYKKRVLDAQKVKEKKLQLQKGKKHIVNAAYKFNKVHID